MKPITFLIFLILISSINCDEYNCFGTDFDPEDVFDTDKEKIDLVKTTWDKNPKNQSCYVSFHLKTLPKNFMPQVIYDCSQHFRGQIKAGIFEGSVPPELKKHRCIHQHDWVFCVCDFSFCNAPQYWTLMIARFLHNPVASVRNPQIVAAAKSVIQTLQLGFQPDSDVSVLLSSNLKCLLWLADMVHQEDYNPYFYLYNYITTRHNAPPLADGLEHAPRYRAEGDDKTIGDLVYANEPEPFEDGTMDGGADEEESAAQKSLHELIVEVDESSGDGGIVALILGAVFFPSTLAATIYVLVLFCRRLKDHSQFPRSLEPKALNRYNALHNPEQIPKEFERKPKKGKKTAENKDSKEKDSKENKENKENKEGKKSKQQEPKSK